MTLKKVQCLRTIEYNTKNSTFLRTQYICFVRISAQTAIFPSAAH